MSKSLKRYFFNFEGIDGCGKDTQLDAFFSYLRSDLSLMGSKYANIWVSREPTKDTIPGTQIANLMRQRDVSKEEATSYFVKDRIIHSERIRNLLDDSFVLLSRYDISTYAYQMAQGMDFNYLYDLHNYSDKQGTLIPDVTFVFDLPVEVAVDRLSDRGGIQECFENVPFQEKVFEKQNEAINLLCRKDGRKFIRIDADQLIKDVTHELISKTENYFKSL